VVFVWAYIGVVLITKGDANEGCHLIDTPERIITHCEPLFYWPTIAANILS